MDIVLVTGNPLKAAESMAILSATGMKARLVRMDLDELQGTPEEIVRAKCVLAAKRLVDEGHVAPSAAETTYVLVDDVSMFIKCLGDLPGPYIKPFFERLENKGLAELVGKYDNQEARAQCLYGMMRVAGDASGDVVLCPGVIDGVIVGKPRGEEKFGWDAIFQPNGYSETFAEMPVELKNSISHRALALQDVTRRLGEL